MSKHDKKQDILDTINSWPSLTDLTTFALNRHGYGNTDGGFGVIYADDLDEYDIEVDKVVIPEGHVQIYGFWGPPKGYEFNITEIEYLDILSEYLIEKDHVIESNQIIELINRIK